MHQVIAQNGKMKMNKIKKKKLKRYNSTYPFK